MQGVTDWQVVNSVADSMNPAFLTDYYAETQSDSILCGERTFTFSLASGVGSFLSGDVLGTDYLTVTGSAPLYTFNYTPSSTTNRYAVYPIKLVVTLPSNPSQPVENAFYFTLTIICESDISVTMNTAMTTSTIIHTIGYGNTLEDAARLNSVPNASSGCFNSFSDEYRLQSTGAVIPYMSHIAATRKILITDDHALSPTTEPVYRYRLYIRASDSLAMEQIIDSFTVQLVCAEPTAAYYDTATTAHTHAVYTGVATTFDHGTYFYTSQCSFTYLPA